MSDRYYSSRETRYTVSPGRRGRVFRSARLFDEGDGLSASVEVDNPPTRADEPLRKQTFVFQSLEEGLCSRLRNGNLFLRVLQGMGDFVEALDGLYIRWKGDTLGVTLVLTDDFMRDNIEGLVRENVREMLDEIIYNT